MFDVFKNNIMFELDSLFIMLWEIHIHFQILMSVSHRRGQSQSSTETYFLVMVGNAAIWMVTMNAIATLDEEVTVKVTRVVNPYCP